jgi:hypothetical protein
VEGLRTGRHKTKYPFPRNWQASASGLVRLPVSLYQRADLIEISPTKSATRLIELEPRVDAILAARLSQARLRATLWRITNFQTRSILLDKPSVYTHNVSRVVGCKVDGYAI